MLALTAAEAPTEFVSVTATAAMVEVLPPTVNGTVSENCDPVANDAALRYHWVNRLLTSTPMPVVCRVELSLRLPWKLGRLKGGLRAGLPAHYLAPSASARTLTGR